MTSKNDYYLIYLYRDGSELALNLLFEKYQPLIYKQTLLYNLDKNTFEDCLQIGRIALFKCIETFNPDAGASFYTFFKLVLFREIYRHNGTSIKYFKIKNKCEEQITLDRHVHESTISPYQLRECLVTPEELDIYDEIILGKVNVLAYAKSHNVKQSTMYLKTNRVKIKLRKYYDKLLNGQ